MSTPQTDLIAAVKAHARANYTRGWDAIVEAAEDAQIAALVVNCDTIQEALTAVRKSGWTDSEGSEGVELPFVPITSPPFLTHTYSGYAFRLRGAVADENPEMIGGSFRPRKFADWFILDNGEGQRWMIQSVNAADLKEIHHV